GLPDPEQRTTARDVARLALALYHRFPREYRYFATREFDFRGETVHSHNHLLDWYDGADGIKTGYVNASGFNLAASAVRDGRRLLGGAPRRSEGRRRLGRASLYRHRRAQYSGSASPLAASSAPSCCLRRSSPGSVEDSARTTMTAWVFEARSSHQPSGLRTRTP